MGLAWVLRVAHRLPSTDFSPAKEQLSAGDFKHGKSPLGGRQDAPISLTLAIPGQGRLCAAQTPSSYSHVGRVVSQVPQWAYQGSCRSWECLVHRESCWTETRKQTNYGEIKWSLERSLFVPEMQFEQSGLCSLQLEALLCDSDAQPKPVITGQIPLVNIYRKQTRL